VILGLCAGLAAAALFGVAAVLQAHAVRQLDRGARRLGAFVVDAVRHPLLLVVVAAYLGGFVLHAVAIWLLPLYLAQASIALSLPIAALGARRVAEHVGLRQWAAVATVVAGLFLLAGGAGDPGSVRVSGAFVAALYAGAAAILLAASVGEQPRGEWFGTLSGLAYAGSALSVRGVAWPLSPLVVLAALAVSAFGLLGFWLYSTGLERGRVSAVTAPMIVGQTAVPGLLGVFALGDGVRPGWWLAVGVGLALAMLGAALVGSPEQPARLAPADGLSEPDGVQPS
jgi:drug/metabolite transporter (DMT)-like permease